MKLPQILLAIFWLVADTFRQALASGIFWLMLAVSTLIIVMGLSVRFEGTNKALPKEPGVPADLLPQNDPQLQNKEKASRPNEQGIDVIKGEMVLAFGLVRIEMRRTEELTLRQVLFWLLQFVDTLGILLTLVWTAGFMPSFLEPHAVSVLLAKPIPRWSLLVGKYIGVLLFVSLQVAYFVIGTWVAVGLATGYWPLEYLLGGPLMMMHFGIFYSFSILLAVYTRSTVVCVFGSILFWMLCWGMNYGRDKVLHLDYLAQQPAPKVEMPKDKDGVPLAPPPKAMEPVFASVTKIFNEVGYWLLPKPMDMGLILYDTMVKVDAKRLGTQPMDIEKDPAIKYVQDQGWMYPEISVLTSLLAAVIILAWAGLEFSTTDY